MYIQYVLYIHTHEKLQPLAWWKASLVINIRADEKDSCCIRQSCSYYICLVQRIRRKLRRKDHMSSSLNYISSGGIWPTAKHKIGDFQLRTTCYPSFKGTVSPDWTCLKIVSMDRFNRGYTMLELKFTYTYYWIFNGLVKIFRNPL